MRNIGKQHAVFGLIGTGGISSSQHLPNLLRAAHVRLKTICDMDAALLRSIQQKFHVAHATTDYKAVLADPEIDAVLIATGAASHPQVTQEALKAGKHVYVEKPLAESEAECHDVVESWRNSGKLAVMGLNRRLAPATEQAMQILAAHDGAFNIHYRIADAYWQWGKDNPPGERVIHELCHVFDLLRYMTRSEVVSVYCVESRADDESILLKFESGCVASIMSSGHVEYDMPKECIEVIVDRGGFFINDFAELQTFGLNDFDPIYRFAGHVNTGRDDAHEQLFASYGADAMMILRRWRQQQAVKLGELQRRAPGHPAQVALEQYIHDYAAGVNYMMDKGWLHALEHFARCILDGELSKLATPEDGMRAAAITEACIRSRRCGQPVFLESRDRVGATQR
jgi:predicted dehydrogenase